MMLTSQRRKTTKDFDLLPEGKPYQLIDGELIMSPSPVYEHQRVVRELSTLLWTIVKQGRLGEVIVAPIDIYVTEMDVFQPDIIFISHERRSIIQDKIHGVPDLVIEVLSPPTAYYDLVHKKAVYEASGVREYWIVDPKEQSVEVFLNTPTGFQAVADASRQGGVRSSIIEHFEVHLTELFPRQ